VATNWYPDNQMFDLRAEMVGMLYGNEFNPGIGEQVLIRRIGMQICICWDGLTGSPLSDCAYCDGEGRLWLETLNTVYMAHNFGTVLNASTVIQQQDTIGMFGLSDQNRAVAYCEYSAFPDYDRYVGDLTESPDRLYELKVDVNGRLITPVVRIGKWKILAFTPHRGDYGQISYIELGLSKETL
jgi:hypothetical protein